MPTLIDSDVLIDILHGDDTGYGIPAEELDGPAWS